MKVLEKAKEVLLRRPRRLSLEEYAEKLLEKGLHPDGTAILDPTPIAPPIGYKKHPSMVEIVRDMVQSERLKAELEAQGVETLEESEDFDVGDELEYPQSGFENDFDPPIEVLLAAGREVVSERERGSHSEQVRGNNRGSEFGEDQPPGARPAPKQGPAPGGGRTVQPLGEGEPLRTNEFRESE